MQQAVMNFDAPYQPTSPTSRAAAEAIREHAPCQEAAVLAAIREAAGTREEVAERLGLRLQSVCGRVSSLLRKRLIRPNGERVGASGRRQEVLEGTTNGL